MKRGKENRKGGVKMGLFRCGMHGMGEKKSGMDGKAGKVDRLLFLGRGATELGQRRDKICSRIRASD